MAFYTDVLKSTYCRHASGGFQEGSSYLTYQEQKGKLHLDTHLWLQASEALPQVDWRRAGHSGPRGPTFYVSYRQGDRAGLTI